MFFFLQTDSISHNAYDAVQIRHLFKCRSSPVAGHWNVNKRKQEMTETF